MMYVAATASDEQNCAEVAQPCLLMGRSCCAAIAATRSGRQVLTSYRAPPQASDSHLRRIMLQKSSSHFAEVMTAGAVDCYLAYSCCATIIATPEILSLLCICSASQVCCSAGQLSRPPILLAATKPLTKTRWLFKSESCLCCSPVYLVLL